MSVSKTGLFGVLVLLFTGTGALAQSSAGDVTSPIGRWVTIDDELNERRSLVTIYEEDGMLYARIDSLYRHPDEVQDPVCEKCDGERKDQRIIGMTIMWDMEPKGDEWSGGRILDPKKGKIYRCKIWIEDGNLRVRGYLGPFYRTQTWLPAEGV
jgi:hypothetical protein